MNTTTHEEHIMKQRAQHINLQQKEKQTQQKKLLVEDFLEMVSKESLGNFVRHQDHKGTGDEWATEGTGENGWESGVRRDTFLSSLCN